MNEVILRKEGFAARATLNRPGALNAITLRMIRALREALARWAADEGIALILIDATGERAFSAGGDIADMHDALARGEHESARRFWREEYRLNAALAKFPKPVVTLLNGFTMGGGVGLGCHASHRVVGERSRIAMPECGIGLVPDVGGSLLLARAPGRVGEYLGTTGTRMGPGDAIFAGFADRYVPEESWPDLAARLEASGDPAEIDRVVCPVPESPLAAIEAEINRHFARESFRDILDSLARTEDAWSRETLVRLEPHAPLALAATIELVRRARTANRIETALVNEYRFAHRVTEQGDFLEGIRAAVIDKDRSPRWVHDSPGVATAEEVSDMLSPLGPEELKLEDAS
ncbi:MAG: enoyl-CoA hydratase/isomerase family protein [Boseongicola sp. SB0670_bin_30]|nr:enoyl-CoA hydratase/isomerase family protein [Boseongicola sp. SB0670_bin_30]